jgi:hypothetical protein
MSSLSEIAREEAGHAIAAFWAGHQIEYVRIGFGPRMAYVRLAAREPASVAEAVESAAIRLIGPEMAPGAAASFPPYCGPVDDATAAMAILDRVSGSVEEADGLLEHARMIARANVQAPVFERLVDQLAPRLLSAGSMPGEQVEAVLTELQGSSSPPGEPDAPLAASSAAVASGEVYKDFGSVAASGPKRGATPPRGATDVSAPAPRTTDMRRGAGAGGVTG